MFKIAVVIKNHDDGFRAYWAHRTWDCVKYEAKVENLRKWLDDRGFLILV